MNKFGYTTLYGATDREFDIAPDCHMIPYEPMCFANLACCIVHRKIHNGCRNCHLCDPEVMAEFLQALRQTFGDGDAAALAAGLQKTPRRQSVPKISGEGRREITIEYSGDFSVVYGGKLEMPEPEGEDPATLQAAAALESVTVGMGDVNAMFTQYSPEAVAEFGRQFRAARVAGTLKIPTVRLKVQAYATPFSSELLPIGEWAVAVDPETLAAIRADMEARLQREILQDCSAPTLAELGGRPNPSGAIDLGSRWRPRPDTGRIPCDRPNHSAPPEDERGDLR